MRMRPGCSTEAGVIAASGGFLGIVVAVIGSLWRARQARLVTTYGSSRWASRHEIDRAGLFRAMGVFLGRLDDRYLRHDGPEHVMAFAPTRSGKGVGLVIPTLLSWTGQRRRPRHQGRELAAHLQAGAARCGRVLLVNPTDPRSARYNPLLEVRQGTGRGPRRPEHRRHPGRSRGCIGEEESLGEDQPRAPGRRNPARALRRAGQDAGPRRHLPVRPAALLRSTRCAR